MNTKIYTLSCPINGDVRYIGKTNNPEQRLKNHLNKARDYNTHKRNWINKLRNQGFKPIFTIIDEVPIDNWQYWEKFYILKFKQLGCDLVNWSDGGEGLSYGNQTSFKKGERGIKIVALEKNGTYFNTFNSILEGEMFCGKKGLESVLSGITKTCADYIWIYEEDYNSFNKDIIDAIVLDANDNSKKGIKTRFKEGSKPWNTGITGIKLKPDKNVYQYNILTGDFIKLWSTAKEAGNNLNINIEGIGQCARNKSKSAGGFIWSYDFKEKIEIKQNVKLKIIIKENDTGYIGEIKFRKR